MRATIHGNVERRGPDDEVFLTSGGFSGDEEQEDEPAEVLRVKRDDIETRTARIETPETSLGERIDRFRDAVRSYERAERAYDCAETQARERRRRARREALRASLTSQHDMITVSGDTFETSDQSDPMGIARDFIKHARDVYRRQRALSRRFASVAEIEVCLDDSQKLLSMIDC